MQLMAEHPVEVSNPDKQLWPKVGLTKLQYIHYLIQVSPWLLKHLSCQPLTVVRFPDGVGEKNSFFQKAAPSSAPTWVSTVPIWSPDREEYIHYVLADKVATLIWLGNLAALEFHIGFAPVNKPDIPTYLAFDLDPTVPGFHRVREVALTLRKLLEKLELPAVAKTSGATGLQVFIRLNGGISFEDTRLFTRAVARYLEASLPDLVTLERLKKNRGDKVYVDFPQHGYGRTLIAPYSARSTENATVSTPVTWSEVEDGCQPQDFTIPLIPARLEKIGDLYASLNSVDLRPILAFLRKKGADGFT